MELSLLLRLHTWTLSLQLISGAFGIIQWGSVIGVMLQVGCPGVDASLVLGLV